MLSAVLKEVVRGAIRGAAQQLAINPRNIRLEAVLDDEVHLLARIDASVVQDLLNKPAALRVLRLRVGNIAYDIDLRFTNIKGDEDRTKRVKQRGY